MAMAICSIRQLVQWFFHFPIYIVDLPATVVIFDDTGGNDHLQ